MKPQVLCPYEAQVLGEPETITIKNLDGVENEHLAYPAKILYLTQPSKFAYVLCSTLDYFEVGGLTRIVRHFGVWWFENLFIADPKDKIYLFTHIQHIPTSNNDNCFGGFHIIPSIGSTTDDEAISAVRVLPRPLQTVCAAQRPRPHTSHLLARRTPFRPTESANR